MGKVKDNDTIESRIDELLKEVGLPGVNLSEKIHTSITNEDCKEILAEALMEIIKIKGNRKGRLVDMAELIDQGAKEEFEKKKTPTVHLSNDWSW